MVVSLFSVRSRGLILLFIIAIFSCNLGQDEDDPTKVNTRALLCFDNKLTYIGCNEAYRLNRSGILNIPGNATDQFCKGLCLVETKLLLKCIDKLASSYLFENNARTQDIRTALDAGCSSTNERGNFDVGGYMQNGISNSKSTSQFPIIFHALAVMALWYFLLMYHR